MGEYIVLLNNPGSAYHVAVLSDQELCIVKEWAQYLPTLTILPIADASDYEITEAIGGAG